MAIGVEEYSPSSLESVPHRSNNVYNHQSDVEQNLSSTGGEFELKSQELPEHFALTYFTDEGIAELVSMLNIVDSAEHLRDINELEFYGRRSRSQRLFAIDTIKQLNYCRKRNEKNYLNMPNS